MRGSVLGLRKNFRGGKSGTEILAVLAFDLGENVMESENNQEPVVDTSQKMPMVTTLRMISVQIFF